jgi:cation transport regulator ChaB
MKRFCFAASVAVVLAASLALPAVAQKGKGGGRGGRGYTPPSSQGDSQPARPFEHPRSGNSLPQEIRDQLPPGLRDKPENHPGLANHLRKMGYKPGTEATPQTKPGVAATNPSAPTTAEPPLANPPAPPATTTPTPANTPPTSVAHPKTGNSLPQEIRDRLPPGLRNQPESHPGLANHLRKMGWPETKPPVDPLPAHVRNQLPPGLRDLPYNHPAVANHLGRMGWMIGEDGTLIPPPQPAPATQYRPFFRRR